MALAVMAMMGTCCPEDASRWRITRGRLEAVHLRHLAVHEDDVVGELGEEFHGFQAVGRHVDPAAQLLQQAHGDFLVDHVVLDHEHAGVERTRALLASGELSATTGRIVRSRRRRRARQLNRDDWRTGLVSMAAIPARCAAVPRPRWLTERQHDQPRGRQRPDPP